MNEEFEKFWEEAVLNNDLGNFFDEENLRIVKALCRMSFSEGALKQALKMSEMLKPELLK